MKWNLKPYTGPPYVFIVKVKGEKKTRRMSAFDEKHIGDQLGKKKFKVLRRTDD